MSKIQLVFILALALVYQGAAYGETSPTQQYAAVVQTSAYGPHMMAGVKTVAQHGAYYNPMRRGSRADQGYVSYVPDTYSIHRPGGIRGMSTGTRMPGLPFRTTANRLIWVN